LLVSVLILVKAVTTSASRRLVVQFARPDDVNYRDVADGLSQWLAARFGVDADAVILVVVAGQVGDGGHAVVGLPQGVV